MTETTDPTVHITPVRGAGRRGVDSALGERIEETLGVLRRIEAEYAPAALASSFSAEDMVLTDLIQRHTPDIGIFTLDTGRLNEETYALQQQVRERYGRRVRTVFPEPEDVEAFIERYGVNGFYDSIAARQACCHARKVAPLERALTGLSAWLTGMRREQAVTRQELPFQEHDAGHGIEKFNPLAAWREEEVWQYLRTFDVPYNALYDQGYRSIGCAPCTRPVAVGEDIRAGRWWWEDPERKECGLHTARQRRSG